MFPWMLTQDWTVIKMILTLNAKKGLQISQRSKADYNIDIIMSDYHISYEKFASSFGFNINMQKYR